MIDISEVEVGDYLVSTEGVGLAFRVVGFMHPGGGAIWPYDEDHTAHNPQSLRKYTGALSVFPGEIGSDL